MWSQTGAHGARLGNPWAPATDHHDYQNCHFQNVGFQGQTFQDQIFGVGSSIIRFCWIRIFKIRIFKIRTLLQKRRLKWSADCQKFLRWKPRASGKILTARWPLFWRFWSKFLNLKIPKNTPTLEPWPVGYLYSTVGKIRRPQAGFLHIFLLNPCRFERNISRSGDSKDLDSGMHL